MPARGRAQWIIVVVAALLFVPGLGAVHLFDWDEINFAEIAREMVVSGDWLRPQMHFEPFHEKPPLFMWLQALSMKAFGVGEFAARFPNAICGILTLLILYRIGEQLRGRVFGMLWALAYAGSILPHLYFRSGIIDPWFNLFIFLGLHALITLTQRDPDRDPNAFNARRDRHAWLVGIFLGLAVLTKGPVGVLVPALVMLVYWAWGKCKPYLHWRRLLIMVLATAITVSIWAVIDLVRNGPEFMLAFFWRQVAMLTTEDAGHGGFPGYHFVVLLIGCFPASVFAVQELLKPTRTSDAHENDHRRWMVILFWVVLLLFSLVKTKIVHYSSLCYFPLTYLAALQLERVWKKREGFGWSRFILGILGGLMALVVIALPFAGMNIDALKPLFARDPFAMANLEADVQWSGLEALAGIVLLAALVVGHLLHGKGRVRAAVLTIFCGSALFVTATLFFFINRIEAYSQRAAIEFFQSHAGERCWLLTKGYKSYVPEYYGQVSAPQPREVVLLGGEIDRPVYLACKITSEEEVQALGTFLELYRKNGFVFYRRLP
ncbi:MAG: glycosyltransferase family 39 protein [Flavobacteriales bacterium]|nr:glycosyltransferase family 39 protein [Flavobacteriales bacterium]